MPILTKEVEVKLNSRNVGHYKGLEYDIPMKKASETSYKKYKKEFVYNFGESIIVKVEDLTKGSHVIVDVLCDYCNKEVLKMTYKDYLRRIKEDDKIVCRNCLPKKTKERNLLLYGVDSYVKTEEFKEKKKETLLKKYGVDAYTKTKEFREKSKQTMLEKYGVENPFQAEEVKKKIRETTLDKYGVDSYTKTDEYKQKSKKTHLERYGVESYTQTKEYQEKSRNARIEKYGENYGQIIMKKAMDTFYEKTGYDDPRKSPEVQEKIKQTCIERYGADNPFSSKEIRKKIAQSFYNNSSQKSSRQQRYICSLYNGILNYPILCYNADIYLPEDNLIIEYDGGGHSLSVIIGEKTIEEFNRKEIIRNESIKRQGYKQMRIISLDDLMPSDEILLQMLSEAKQYFLQFPSHSWIEYNIDTSSVRNAEHKDGVFFNFGKLRRINKDELLEIA